MASSTPQGAKLLYGLQRNTRFTIGLGEKLPAAYRKFYAEWKLTAPTAVHYVPRDGQFERDALTGLVRPVQNVPLPVYYPPEHNAGMWGGEGVIKGFQKREQTKRRVPHYWVPVLRRTVVRSLILDRYMSMVVTDRTMRLVHESHGFDHYVLKTPACDLKSELALRLKRQMLQALQAMRAEEQREGRAADARRTELLREYGRYAEQYSAEEVEWYGLTWAEAIKKIKLELLAKERVEPQKLAMRSQLLERLRAGGIAEAGGATAAEGSTTTTAPAEESPSWFSKVTTFGKKPESK